MTLCQANVEDLKAQLRTLRLELGEADRVFWDRLGKGFKDGMGIYGRYVIFVFIYT